MTATTAPRVLPHPVEVPTAYGHLELLELADHSKLIAAGWMLLPDGPFDNLVVRNLTTRQEFAAAVVDRQGLGHALPWVPRANLGGFLLEVPVAVVPWPGTIDLELVGFRDGVPAGSMRIDVHCAAKAQHYPPGGVMRRASGNDGHDYWRATGIKACNDFARAMARYVDFSRVQTLLEWGCGSGRLTKHIIDRLPHVRVSGTDIDVEAVTWAGQHLDGTFVPCRTEPPLPFADHTFDVIFALSVCTHLTLRHQRLWLPELQRVIRPGGTLAATTHGEFAARWIFHRRSEYQRVMADGFFDGLADEGLGPVASGDYYRSTFQSRDWTIREWGRWFHVVEFIEGGINNLQDVFVLRPK